MRYKRERSSDMAHNEGRPNTVWRLWMVLKVAVVLIFVLQLPAQVALGGAQQRLFLPVILTSVATNAAACQLPELAGRGDVGLGFPRYADRLATSGVIRAKVLFVDFADVPAAQTPQQLFALISPGSSQFFQTVSYGALDWQFDPYFTWLRMSKSSNSYNWQNLGYDDFRAYLQEAVALADANVDFSDADTVVVLTNPAATNIFKGPAFAGAPQWGGYSADGVTFYNGLASGADLPTWGALWLNHEAGHTMGLPDLYAFAGTTHRFIGGFDNMGLIAGKAPEHMAYNRWLLGWLSDSQIFCQQTATATIALSAIEQPGGIKAAMVRVGPSSLVAVETRRALGYDTNLPKSGALVYTIDSAISSGNGPIRVVPDSGDLYQAPLALGEQVTVGKVTIKVVQATIDGDVVQITVAP
jgi:M6 family metalloprotease-like protein